VFSHNSLKTAKKGESYRSKVNRNTYQPSSSNLCADVKKRIPGVLAITRQKQGIWWSLVGIPNNTNLQNLFAVCVIQKLTKEHTHVENNVASNYMDELVAMH
jgi:hypothetical protein